MRVVTPHVVDEEVYAGGNLAEDEYPEWMTGEDLEVGDYRTVLATHSTYQCLVDHTSDNDNSPTTEAAAFADPIIPDPKPAHWVYAGSTNKWRVFDKRPTQRATRSDRILVVLANPAAPTDTIAFLGMVDCHTIGVELLTQAGIAQLSWTEPANGGLAITHYEYRYRRTGEASWGEWATITGSGPTTTSAFVMVNPSNTDYVLEIRAVNSNGNGAEVAASLVSTTYEASDAVPAPRAGARLAGGQVMTTPTTVPSAPSDFVAIQSRTRALNTEIELYDTSLVVDWRSFFFAGHRLHDQYLLETPILLRGDGIFIDIQGEDDLGCGQIVFGGGVTIGETITDNASIEILDYSEVEIDRYGNLSAIEREATEVSRYGARMDVNLNDVAATTMRAQKGAKLALWVAVATNGVRGWSYAFLKDYRSYFEKGRFVKAQIDVQGVV